DPSIRMITNEVAPMKLAEALDREDVFRTRRRKGRRAFLGAVESCEVFVRMKNLARGSRRIRMQSIDFFPSAAAIGLYDEPQAFDVGKLQRFDEISRCIRCDRLIGGRGVHGGQKIAFYRVLKRLPALLQQII